MTLKAGEKVHIATRRLFDSDLKRHFLGEVVEREGSLVRLRGYAFVFNPYKDEYVKRPEKRIRILDVSDASHIVNVLPGDIVLEDVSYQFSEERRLIVTDGKNFRLDVNEFGIRR